MSTGISKTLIDKTAEYVAKIGDSFIDTLKQRYKNEPNYAFLFSESPEHHNFLSKIFYYRSLLLYKDPSSAPPVNSEQAEIKKKEPVKQQKATTVRPRKKFQDEDISVGIMATLLKLNADSTVTLDIITKGRITSRSTKSSNSQSI